VEFDGITCRHPEVVAQCEQGWCRIPPGCFIQGSPADEFGHPAYTEDQRAVILTHAFWIQQYEVTQADWGDLGLSNPSGSEEVRKGKTGGDCTSDPNCPVGRVSWFEALAYANLLSEHHDPPLPTCYTLTGCTGELGQGMVCTGVMPTTSTLYDCRGYRLPTGAEWEYAARAGTRTAFYSGAIVANDAGDITACDHYEHLDRSAWYCSNSGDWSHPVGQKRPNAWHLYDMMGNAREWVTDEYTGQTPPPGPLTNPGGVLGSGTRRQTRGGAAFSPPNLLRSASRLESGWTVRGTTFGLRLVRTE